MRSLNKNCAYIRSYIFPVRLLSAEVEKYSKLINQNRLQDAERSAKEPIFYHNKAQLNADIKGNKFSFQYQTTAKMNYDLWRFLVEFVEMNSYKELQKAKRRVADLADQLQNAKSVKTRIEVELEEIRREQKEIGCESVILTLENDLQKAESSLSASVKKALDTEQNIYNDFLTAVHDYNKSEEQHSRFLRASIFFWIIVTFILTVIARYIYHLDLHQEKNKKADKIEEHNKSWGSYMKSYVSPLYNWAIPKK